MKLILFLLLINILNVLIYTVNCAPYEVEPEVPIEIENATIEEGDMLYENDDPNVNTAFNANILAKKWPQGIIYYQIDTRSGFTNTEVSTILLSMRKIESQTNNCLRFVQRTSQPAYIVIRNTATGCNSYVGQTRTQPQTVSLQRPGCVAQSVVIHELLHVAGFEHEQSRPDRDQYVTINYNNISPNSVSQFRSYPSSVVSTLNQPYDYYSIMHYSWNAFSRNGLPTIVPKSSAINMFRMGNSNEMTAIDIKKVKIFYGCQ